MPRFYSPNNIQAHRTGTLTANVAGAYESFGASGLTPVADNVVITVAGGAIAAADCPGITSATVINYHATDTVYVTARDPAGLGSDAEAIALPAQQSVSLDLAGHAGVERIYVKGPGGGASVGVTIAYTEVAQ